MDSISRKVWFPDGKVIVKNMKRLVEAIESFVKPRSGELNRFLFRGAANKKHSLEPSLPRMRKGHLWLTDGMLGHIEEQAIQQFSSKAHLYIDRTFLPPDDDPKKQLRWLEFMQHYGVKTRLLDWTVSPYVAAYFAVVDEPKADGVIWMVEAGAHGQRMGEQFPQQFDESRNREMPLTRAQLGFYKNRKHKERAEAERNAELEKLASSLLFFPCSLPNERMVAQRGWFSCPSVLTADHETAIATAFKDASDRRWAQKIFIDKGAKPSILRELWHMNITGETMFPGLDGLGKAMAQLTRLLTPSSTDFFRLESGLLARVRKIGKLSS